MSSNVATLTEITTSFKFAVSDPDNHRADGINWDFVDAVIHMNAGEAGKVLPEEYYDIFDALIDAYLEDA